MEATKLQDGFYWVQFPFTLRGLEVARLHGTEWWTAGNELRWAANDARIVVLSSRLDVNDGQYKTAFEQASKSVDSAHELLDAVREIVTDYNAAQVDDDAEVFDSLEAIEMISELIL